MRSILLHASFVTILSAATLDVEATTAAGTDTHEGTVVASCHGHPASIVGTEANDDITGTPGRDVIAALAGNDTVNGRGGNDLICGGRGTDRLDGGAGNDHIYGGKDGLVRDEGEVDRIGDSLRGGEGDDWLDGGPVADRRGSFEVVPDAYLFDRAPRRVDVDLRAGTARGDGHDRLAGHHVAVLGSRYGDVIKGTDGADYLNGGPGPDVVYGYGGADRLIGDSGRSTRHSDDVLHGGAGDDDMSATAGSDTLTGGPGRDSMDDIGRSSDVMSGGPGRDLVIDEIGPDGPFATLDGGPGVDHLSLLSSVVNPHADPATGSWDMRSGAMTFDLTAELRATATKFEDADLATWGTGWTIDGTGQDNLLIAGGGAGTTFFGHAGDDRFMGSTYPDVFDGGPGHDRSLSMGVDDNDTCISVEVFDYPDCDHIS
ncbi:MAG TPA: calcium-binding protein [Mycobacteriales bacterium]|nr:calcium-binding protein [Mycobacteriales bacterium]